MGAAPGVSLSLVRLDQADGVATITVNRPEVLNQVNPAVLHQFHQALEQAAGDPQVRGIVIGGEGKAFVVGADIGFFIRNVEAGDLDRIVQFTKAGHRLMNAVDCCPKPVVARVHGVALGAGVELALACDWIVASPRASFGFPETGLGIYPGFGGTQRTPRRIGVGLAAWMILSGKTLSAADAWKVGLVDEVVPEEGLNDAARRCALGEFPQAKPDALPPEIAAIARFFERNNAEQLRTGTAETQGNAVLVRAMRPVAAKAPIALRLAEHLIREGMTRTLQEGLQMEIDHAGEIFATQDAYQGLCFRARGQLGQPRFVGR